MDLETCYARFNYSPYRGQRKIHELIQENRRNAILLGRRGGKSYCSSFESAIGLLQPPRFGSPMCLVTAPSTDLTEAVFERSHDLIFQNLKGFRPKFNRVKRYIELQKLGSRLYVRSGDKPKQVVSRGYDKIIVDEAGFYRDDVFKELEPTLLERQGVLVAIGVPALQNWYLKLYKKARAKADGYGYINLPSICNPAISHEEWHRLFRETNRDEFLRQYCAKFIEDSHQVFKLKFLEKLTNNLPEEYDPKKRYWAGVDLARKKDYTVVTIVCKEFHKIRVVASLKINNRGWNEQVQMIAFILMKFNVENCYVDGTGIGDVVISNLVEACPMVGITPYIFTNESKCNVIDDLAVEIESNNIEIPICYDYLSELSMYECFTSIKGLRVFSAPDNEHDDCVISLGLANRAVKIFDYV